MSRLIVRYARALDWVLAQPDLKFGQYQGRFKLQGIKFVLDGEHGERLARNVPLANRRWAGPGPHTSA